jgi:hypothetical protein
MMGKLFSERLLVGDDAAIPTELESGEQNSTFFCRRPLEGELRRPLEGELNCGASRRPLKGDNTSGDDMDMLRSLSPEG